MSNNKHINNFFQESWNEYIEFIHKYVPESTLSKYKANKRKIISVLVIVIFLELLLISFYLKQDNQNTIDTNTSIQRS